MRVSSLHLVCFGASLAEWPLANQDTAGDRGNFADFRQILRICVCKAVAVASENPFYGRSASIVHLVVHLVLYLVLYLVCL